MDSITSVGSYTNEASLVSGHSDDVWNYLSVEERECLLFLEETIDSLNIEELEQTETELTRNGSQSEKVPPPYPESPPLQLAERAGKIPRAVLPLGPSTPDTRPAQVVESKSGSNTLPKSGWRGGGESGRLEASAGEGRRRSLTTPAHPSLGAKDERGKHGPPTAPKPGRLPQNILLRSYHQNNGPHPQSIYRVSQDSGRGNGHSKDGSAEAEAQHVRQQALAKLGLLTETDGIRRNRRESLKVPGGSLGPAGDEKITGHPGTDIEQTKHPDPRGPSVGSGSDANHSTANLGAANANRLHWQHPAATSASLKTFSTPGDTSFPSARSTSTNTVLVAGTSKTLPSVKRSVNVGDGLARNSSLPPWALGPSKTSSLKRFGTSGDNSQPRAVTVTAAPGPHKLPKPRPMSICSEADLAARLGNASEGMAPEKPAGRFFPMKIHHISAKPHRSPPKGLNVQSASQQPSNKDHKDALRKLGLLKE